MKSKVYFIQARGDENYESLARKVEKAYLKLDLNKNIKKESFVALKIHFGEQGNTGFIKPQWLSKMIKNLRSKSSRVFFTDTNTLYLGKRTNSIDHLHLAWEHGFASEITGIPIIIADGLIGRDDKEVKINLNQVKSAKISSAIIDSDFIVCLSHLTGHIVTGVGGSIKNLAMGCASRAGKLEQHSDVRLRINPKKCKNCGVCLDNCPAQAISLADNFTIINEEKCIGCGECLVVCKFDAVKMRWDEDCRRIQEKMAEYALSVMHLFKEKIGFLNFLLKVTKDCDCLAENQPPIVEDIGILASLNPVALDKASVDLVIRKSGKDVFRAGYNVDWIFQMEHGARIGLGSMDYELIEIA